MEEILHIHDELREQRLVQAHFFLYGGDDLVCGEGAGHRLGRAAGDEAYQQEGHQQHGEKLRNEYQHPLSYEF